MISKLSISNDSGPYLLADFWIWFQSCGLAFKHRIEINRKFGSIDGFFAIKEVFLSGLADGGKNGGELWGAEDQNPIRR